MIRTTLVSFLLIAACAHGPQLRPGCRPLVLFGPTETTDYPVHADYHTLGGIAVDGPTELDAKIDAIADQVQQCLDGIDPDDQRWRTYGCWVGSERRIVSRNCITVRIAPTVPACATPGLELVRDAHAPDAVCNAKGWIPLECADRPCRYAWGLQEGGRVAVTGPGLHGLAEAFVRQATGCAFVWWDPLAECVAIGRPR